MQTKKPIAIKKRRIIAGVLAALMAVVIFAFSAVPGDSYPAHPGFLNIIAHFFEYLIFASLLTIALTGGSLKAWQVILFAVMIASLYAASDEIHQYFVPGRWSDPADWAVDTLGATVGAVLTFYVLKRLE